MALTEALVVECPSHPVPLRQEQCAVVQCPATGERGRNKAEGGKAHRHGDAQQQRVPPIAGNEVGSDGQNCPGKRNAIAGACPETPAGGAGHHKV